jgi:hypothetical protein
VRLSGRFALRLVVGNIRTGEPHVARAWQVLRAALQVILDECSREASMAAGNTSV